MKITIITLIAAGGLSALPILSSAAEPASASAADQTQVTETVRAMFAAFSANDREKFRAVTTPDFYAFDVGVRFTADALLDLIEGAKAKGTAYVWTVNDPEVRVVGDVAWITYVNRGSITDSSGKEEITWLESAVLQRDKGAWRIQFFHSTRARGSGN